MSPEKQQIAIAEFRGWSKRRLGDGVLYHVNPKGQFGVDERGRVIKFPDYLNDLNVMHEAGEYLRKIGNQFQWLAYIRQLFKVIWKRDPTGGDSVASGLAWDVIHATAAQRAEALLRTIGKWEEETK